MKLALTLVVLFTALSLVTGAAWLEWPVPFLFDVPFGNLLTWAGMVCLALLPLRLARQGSSLRRLSWVAVALAAPWFPVSVLLIGNLRLSGGQHGLGTVWMVYSALAVAVPLLLLVARAFGVSRPSAGPSGPA